MLALAVNVILWVVTLIRLSQWHRRRTVWNLALFVAAAAGSAATTLHTLNQTPDSSLVRANWLRLATDISYLVGASSFALYFESLSRKAPRQAVVRWIVVCDGLAALFLLALWIPAHRHPNPALTRATPDAWWLAYDIAFYGYMFLVLLYSVLWCSANSVRGPLSRGQRGAVAAMGLGCLGGMIAIGQSLAADFRHQGRGGDSMATSATRNEVTYIASLILGLALLVLPAIPALRRYIRARRDIRCLYPLWARVTPDVPRLDAPRTGDLLSDAEFRAQRLIVEIRDGLRSSYVHADPGAGVAALAAALRQGPHRLGVTVASSVLPATSSSHEDRVQLLELAQAYAHAGTVR